MKSRKSILEQVRRHQPAEVVLPSIIELSEERNDFELFSATLASIGGNVVLVNSLEEIRAHIVTTISASMRIISTVPQLNINTRVEWSDSNPHDLQDVELAVINGHFAVAENGAVWITEELLKLRVLPFICQHLALVINKQDIVATMHHAYDRIGNDHYGYGTFIAGPSKTADIEQSLVLGAHGPKTATVFVMENEWQ